MHFAIIGSRGYPSTYGGFVVAELGEQQSWALPCHFDLGKRQRRVMIEATGVAARVANAGPTGRSEPLRQPVVAPMRYRGEAVGAR